MPLAFSATVVLACTLLVNLAFPSCASVGIRPPGSTPFSFFDRDRPAVALPSPSPLAGEDRGEGAAPRRTIFFFPQAPLCADFAEISLAPGFVMNCLLLLSAVCLLSASAARRLSASISVHPQFLSLPSTYRCSVPFVTSWLKHGLTILRCPRFTPPRTISNKQNTHSTRQIPTRCAPWISAQQTMWVNEGKMFGPKPSLFPRVIHTHLHTTFARVTRKKNTSPIQYSSFSLLHLFTSAHLHLFMDVCLHSPLPIPHSPLATSH